MIGPAEEPKMPDTPVEAGPQGAHPSDMETTVAMTQALAQNTQTTLQWIREELSHLRRELGAQGAEFRGELTGQGVELRDELAELRRMHDRDFRLIFGAMIAGTLGLAALIARTARSL